MIRSRVLRSDGAARGNPGPAGAGAVVQDDRGHVLREISAPLGSRTNNQAEYEALLLGLRALLEEAGEGASETRVTAELDSELVVRQLGGLYRVRDPDLRGLHERARALISRFASFEVRHVGRAENERADELANRAIDDALRAAAGEPPSDESALERRSTGKGRSAGEHPSAAAGPAFETFGTAVTQDLDRR